MNDLNDNNDLIELEEKLEMDDKKKMKIAFKKYIIELVIFIFIGFLIGYFVTELVFNNNFSYYEFNIETESAPEYIFREDYFSNRVIVINDYNNYAKKYNESHEDKMTLYTFSSGIDFEGIAKNAKYEEISKNNYLIKIPAKYFKDTFVTSSQKISTGATKCKNNMSKILTLVVTEYDGHSKVEPINVVITSKEVVLADHHNPYLFGLLASGIMGLITVSLFFITYRSKNKDYFLDISDNEKIFRTPFHKKYWKSSVGYFKKVKDLTLIAMIFGMMLVCKLIPIPSGFGSLGLSFTYLFFALLAMIYGPTVGLIIGLFSDVLGYFIAPSGGAFFPGYTLDAMIAGFTYGICFYKTKITFTKCLLSRVVVNFFVNVFLGSIWWSIMYDLTYDAYLTYMLTISLPKNILYLLPQSILLFIVLKAMARPLCQLNLIDERIKDHVTIF